MKRVNQRLYYPVFLNLEGKKCLVIGGGKIAHRKVKMLLEHNADVEVISPVFCPEIGYLADNGQIRTTRRQYQTGDLERARIVIVATGNRSINQQISKEALRCASLVNFVDETKKSDFIVPSYLRLGGITIAISTGGLSPALARKIRTILEKELGSEYNALLELITEVRAEAKASQLNIDGDAWQEALDLDVLVKLLKNGAKEKAKTILLDRLTRSNK